MNNAYHNEHEANEEQLKVNIDDLDRIKKRTLEEPLILPNTKSIVPVVSQNNPTVKVPHNDVVLDKNVE